jgi:hypothetical protein
VADRRSISGVALVAYLFLALALNYVDRQIPYFVFRTFERISDSQRRRSCRARWTATFEDFVADRRSISGMALALNYVARQIPYSISPALQRDLGFTAPAELPGALDGDIRRFCG